MSGITQIMKKELDRVFKDKKMLFSTFVLPVAIMMVVITLTNSFAQNAMDEVDEHTSVIYLQHAPQGFEEFLKTSYPNISLSATDDPIAVKEMLKAGEADLLIVFPENFLKIVSSYPGGDEIPQIKTFYNPTESFSTVAFMTISGGALEMYRQQFIVERVGDINELTVFYVNSDNPGMEIMDDQRAGGQLLGAMIPYFVTILLFAGALGTGTDMVAGEKERGTMASLLVSPIKRSSIVLGKVFSLMTITGLSSIVYIAAMVLFMPQMMGVDSADVPLSFRLSVEQIVMLVFMMLVLAFVYSAIIVLISVFAKTIKEATSYIMPAYMLVIIIGLSTMFTSRNVPTFHYLIPIYNSSLALQGVFTQQITGIQFGLSIGVMVILGVGLVIAIAKAFESEKVMSI